MAQQPPELGPADPVTTAEWLAADDAAAAATLRALADKIERGEVIGHYVARYPERFPVRPNGARYRIEIAVDMPPDVEPIDDRLDVGIAASVEDAEHFAGWNTNRLISVDVDPRSLAGLVVRNVYVTDLAAERITPELVTYLRRAQQKYRYPASPIRTLSGGCVD